MLAVALAPVVAMAAISTVAGLVVITEGWEATSGARSAPPGTRAALRPNWEHFEVSPVAAPTGMKDADAAGAFWPLSDWGLRRPRASAGVTSEGAPTEAEADPLSSRSRSPASLTPSTGSASSRPAGPAAAPRARQERSGLPRRPAAWPWPVGPAASSPRSLLSPWFAPWRWPDPTATSGRAYGRDHLVCSIKAPTPNRVVDKRDTVKVNGATEA
jgi:hypothetical protein